MIRNLNNFILNKNLILCLAFFWGSLAIASLLLRTFWFPLYDRSFWVPVAGWLGLWVGTFIIAGYEGLFKGRLYKIIVLVGLSILLCLSLRTALVGVSNDYLPTYEGAINIYQHKTSPFIEYIKTHCSSFPVPSVYYGSWLLSFKGKFDFHTTQLLLKTVFNLGLLWFLFLLINIKWPSFDSSNQIEPLNIRK